MKIKNLIAIAALLMGSMSVSAQTASGIFKINVAAGKATITGFKADCPASSQVNVEVPGTLVNEGGDDFTVVAIAANAFKSNANLKSISIAKSVTEIGASAFEDCSQLATITFEEGSQLAVVGSKAFGDTPSLTAISFANCLKLKYFTINGGESKTGPAYNAALDGAIAAGDAAPADFATLTGAPAADAASVTGAEADAYNAALPGAINVAATDTYTTPFVNATNVNYQLKTITFGAATTDIGTALAGLKALTTVNLGETAIVKLVLGSLANTDALTTLTLPGSCLSIDATGKTGLTSLTINATGGANALTMAATSFTMSNTANSTVTFGNIVNQNITANAIVGPTAPNVKTDLTIGNITGGMSTTLISGNVGAVVVGTIGGGAGAITVNNAVFGNATSISFGEIKTNGSIIGTTAAVTTPLTSVTFTGDVVAGGIGALAFARYTNLATVNFQGKLVAGSVVATAFVDGTIYAGSAAEAGTDGARLTVTYLPKDEDAVAGIIDAEAFAANTYLATAEKNVKISTTRTQGLLLPATMYRAQYSFAAEEVEITVAKKDGKYWYGTHFKPAPLKIAKEQNGDKVMVYGAYVDQDDNTIYMDQLHVIKGFYYVPANVPVVVKSNTAEKVKAVGLAATDAAYVKFGSMNLKDATHWQNEICVNNVAGRNTGAKVQNATADNDWTINPDGAAATVDNNDFAIFFLYPAATYNFYWNSITASAKAPDGAFYLRMNKALINAGARVNIVWNDGSEETTAIQAVKNVNVENNAIYNLAGQKVNAAYKGVVIKNGKKMIQK